MKENGFFKQFYKDIDALHELVSALPRYEIVTYWVLTASADFGGDTWVCIENFHSASNPISVSSVWVAE